LLTTRLRAFAARILKRVSSRTFVVGLPLALLVHEAAHPITALAVGFRVYRVEIGGQRPLTTGWWGQPEIVVGRSRARTWTRCRASWV